MASESERCARVRSEYIANDVCWATLDRAHWGDDLEQRRTWLGDLSFGTADMLQDP